MKESHDEGPATHAGPESCTVFRKESREALTGVVAEEIDLEIASLLPADMREAEREWPDVVGADSTAYRAPAAIFAPLSSLSPAPPRRHHVRQEPHAAIPLLSGSVEGAMGNHDSYSDSSWRKARPLASEGEIRQRIRAASLVASRFVSAAQPLAWVQIGGAVNRAAKPQQSRPGAAAKALGQV
jgi:hypothetical protein